MDKKDKKLEVVFFKNDRGTMPVKVWLKKLSKESKKLIGEDIKKVQFGWPLGMPVVRHVDTKLWEIRSDLNDRTTARIFFTLYENNMVLLHGIIKKTRKTPKKDLDMAKKRRDKFLK